MNDFLISFAASVVVAVLGYYLPKLRKIQLERQLDKVKEEEEFIIRLNKSSVRLTRFSFLSFFMSCTIVFGALGAAALLKGFDVFSDKWLLMGVGYALVMVTSICFSTAQSIYHSSDIGEAKERFQKKRESIQNKLDS